MYRPYVDAIQKEKRDSGVGAFQPPASEREILGLRRRSVAELGSDIPAEYADFLRITNGLMFNGVCIYGSRNAIVDLGHRTYELPGFVESTLEWRSIHDSEDFLVFADSDLDIYTYNLIKARYEVFDRGARDREIADYSSFDELITDALWTSLTDDLRAKFPGTPPIQRPWPVD